MKNSNLKYKKLNSTYLLFMIACMYVTTIKAQEFSNTKTIFSKVLNEDRTYEVILPKNYSKTYNSKQNYPVIYVLDGGKRNTIINEIYKFLADNKRPLILESIIVAVHQKNRSYELTPNKATHFYNGSPIPSDMKMGGANEFYSFIKDDLHKSIQKNYRTNDFNILVGHSFGGLFALHVQHKNDDFFKGYVVIDPSLWWKDGYLVDEFIKKVAAKEVFKASMYLILAGPDGDDAHMVNNKKLGKLLKNNPINFPNADFVFHENKNHYTVLIPAFQDGLTHLLKDESFEYIDKRLTRAYVVDYFKRKSSLLGAQLHPTNDRIISYGDLCMMKRMPQQALVFYNWAIENGVPKAFLQSKLSKIKDLKK